jgi:GST-like protein
MIELHAWNTPNGRKVSIMLEELSMAYKYFPVNIGKDEQFAPAFLAISPNNRIPAIVDPDGPDGKPISVFESGAILIYLAEKARSPLFPSDPRQRTAVLEWLMWQMGGVGPMVGQAHHFLRAAKEKIPYGIDRYVGEANRLYGVLDRRLAGRDFMCDAYSIADIATYPWITRWEWIGIDWSKYPHVKRWFDAISDRPAVKKGLDILAV